MARLRGTVAVPSDKSLTHRAILFAALSRGESDIRVLKPGRDNLASLRAVSQLGVGVRFTAPPGSANRAKEEKIPNVESCSKDKTCLIPLDSPGFRNFSKPKEAIYCGNSGTTARLLCGILAGQDFCLLYTSPSPRDGLLSRMPSSA